MHGRRRVPGSPASCLQAQRLAELLRRQRRRRMCGHANVDDGAAAMRQNHEHEQQSVGHGRHDEEGCGGDLVAVIGQERPPCLGVGAGGTACIS